MREYSGSPPAKCDLCGRKITDLFVDGATRMGPWANMCGSCHVTHGRGLGTGAGQEYQLLPRPGSSLQAWFKTAG